MRLPDLSLGTPQEASIIIPPDIGEHNELARKIQNFLREAQDLGIKPSQRDREYKNISLPQPGGVARMDLMYSEDDTDRLAAEIQVGHASLQTSVQYALIGNLDYWQREQQFSRAEKTVTKLTQTEMIEDMSEYVSHKNFDHLLDNVVVAKDVVHAMARSVALKARSKKGTDFYRVTVPIESSTGYAAAKMIELSDQHHNRRVIQRLSITALSEVSSKGPVDVRKTISYEVKRNPDGSIRADSLKLALSSEDGLSRDFLARSLDPKDTKYSPLQLLHRALDEATEDLTEIADAA